MRIVLLADISGTRNGATWPPRGFTVDLPEDEAAQMCRAQIARPATDADQAASEATRRHGVVSMAPPAGALEEIIPGPAPEVPVVATGPTGPVVGDAPLTTESGPRGRGRARVGADA